MATASQDREARFHDFLMPIRDLAKNWNIDIACNLEDYLTELEEVAITFDDGRTTMDFAEAALVIQGSSCVYSKKVDFLYNLVHQLLELLRHKKKGGKAKVAGNVLDMSADLDELDDLVSYDDIQAADNIDLPPGEFSNPGRNLVPPFPASLIPLNADERGTFMLYDSKGTLIGNRMDFKVNSWFVDDKTGALLQDPALLDPECFEAESQYKINEASSLNLESSPGHMQYDENPGEGGFPDCSDDNPLDPLPVDDAPVPDSGNGEEEEEKGARKKRGARKRERLTSDEKALKILSEKLDPHEVVGTDRILRKMKVRKFDSTNPKNPFHLKPGSKGIIPDEISICDFIEEAFYTPQERLPAWRRKRLSNKGLEERAVAVYKERQAKLKMLAKKGQGSFSTSNEEDEEYRNFTEDNSDIEDEEADCFLGLPDPDSEEEEAQPIFGPTSGAVNDFGEEINIGPSDWNASYVALVKQYANDFVLESKSQKQITETQLRVKTWSDKMAGVLEEEEKYVAYDMRKYCTNIIETFSPLPSKQTLNFSKVVEKQTPAEVCRYFLATLQLANNNNVEITTSGDQTTIKDFELTLLSRRQHFEELEELPD